MANVILSIQIGIIRPAPIFSKNPLPSLFAPNIDLLKNKQFTPKKDKLYKIWYLFLLKTLNLHSFSLIFEFTNFIYHITFHIL